MTNTIPFIIQDLDNTYKITKEAEEFLLNLPQDLKLGILSIVGKQRSGKSYFINKIILNKNEFKVGNTINACTRGLVLLKEPLLKDDKTGFLVVDTEGIGNPNSSISSDSKIFLLSLLLSSLFIFNSMQTIDEQSFQELQVMLNLAKDIEQKNGNQNMNFPSFYWVVRDFALQMENKNNEKIDCKQYLEKSLEDIQGMGEMIEQKNKLRKQFKHFFTDRECQVLIRPVEQEQQLQNLIQLSDDQLRPQFLKQIDQLRQKIFQKIQPKKIGGQQLNGAMLVQIINEYCEIINKGNIPIFNHCMDFVFKNEAQRLYKNQKHIFNEEVAKLLNKFSLDIEIDLKNQYKQIQQSNMKTLETNLKHLNQNQTYEQLSMFQQDIYKKSQEIRQQQNKLIYQFLDKNTKDQFQQININLRSQQYENENQFKDDFDQYKNLVYSYKCFCEQTQDQYIQEKSQNLQQMAQDRFQDKNMKLSFARLSYDSNMAQQNDDIHQELQNLKGEISDSKRRESQVLMNNQLLELDNQKLRSESVNYLENQTQFQKQFHQIFENEKKQLKSQIQQGDDKIKQQKLEIQQYKRDILVLDDKLKNKEDENYQIKQNNIEIQAQYKELQIKIRNIEELNKMQINNLNQEMISNQQNFQSENENLLNTIEEIKDQLMIYKQKEFNSVQKIESLHNDNIKLKGDLIQTKQVIQQEQSQSDVLKNNDTNYFIKNQLENQLTFLQKKYDNKQKDLQSLKQHIQQLDEKNQKYHNENQVLQNKDLKNIQIISDLQLQIKNIADKSQKTIFQLTNQYEEQINWIKKQKNNDISMDFLKCRQEDDLTQIKEQIFENKKFQDNILHFIQQSQYKNEESEYQQNLNSQLQNLQLQYQTCLNRNQYLEEKYQKYNDLKKLLKNYIGLQCFSCQKIIQFDNIKIHYEQCKEPSFFSKNDNSNCFAQNKLEIISVEPMLKGNGNFLNYQIKCREINEWIVKKNIQQFLELRNNLTAKHFKQPESGKILEIQNKSVFKSNNNTIHTYLLKYLQDLTLNEEILNSDIFRQFIGIEDEQFIILNKDDQNLRVQDDSQIVKIKHKKISDLSPQRANRNSKTFEPNYIKNFTKHQYNEKDYECQKILNKSNKKDIYQLPSQEDEITSRNPNKIIIQQKIEQKINRLSVKNNHKS